MIKVSCTSCGKENILANDKQITFFCSFCGATNNIFLESDIPKQIENPDLTSLRGICQDMIDEIVSGEYHPDQDWNQYIYECAIETIFGNSIWDFIRKNT